MDKVQALLRGRYVRGQLVGAVREEYERTVAEIEGAASTIYWPRKGILCLPEFTAQRETAQHQSFSPLSSSPELSQEENPVISDDQSVSEGDGCRGDALGVVDGAEPTDQKLENEEADDDVRESTPSPPEAAHQRDTSDVLIEMLHSKPLIIGDLPTDRHSLLELETLTAMELVWVKQAISSRQKYLQLKDKMGTPL